MPKQLRLVTWKQHVKAKEEKNVRKVNFWRGLQRVYMDQNALIKENTELKRLLRNKHVLTSLSFARLSYISNNKSSVAEDVQKLHDEIFKLVGTG